MAIWAYTTENRGQLRRWTVSAAIVVAVHAAIVLAVLTWRESVRREASGPGSAEAYRPSSPFLIDLPPAETTESRQGTPEAVTLPSDAAAPPAANEIIPNAPTAQPTERVEEPAAKSVVESKDASLRPAEAPTVAGAPAAVPPLENAEKENGAETATAGGGGGALVALPNNERGGGTRVDPGPLDTSITVVPVLHPRTAVGIFDRNRTTLFRQAKRAAERRIPGDLGAVGGLAANTHGAHVQDRTRAAMLRAIGRTEPASVIGSAATLSASGQVRNVTNGAATPSITGGVRNAIGGTVMPSTADGVKNAIGGPTAKGTIATAKIAVGAPAATSNVANGNTNPSQGTATNAVSMAVRVAPVAGTNGGEHKPGLSTVPVAAVPVGTINGRDMGRPALAPGAIGGPTKVVPGVLNGTSFRSRASVLVR